IPSVFKLSLSMKRTRPRTLGGKPAMISTEAGDFDFLWVRRTAVPAVRSAKFFGAQINPANALAATTAGEPRYTYASRSPMRPLKLRLVAHGRSRCIRVSGFARCRRRERVGRIYL